MVYAAVVCWGHHVVDLEEYSDPNILSLLREIERAEEQQQQQLQELGYNVDREILSLDTN